jgi:1-phosphatidylinositol-3-phosphate 5-kinase
MDDQNCKECYDCKSPFSTWRRKHHCRICGQIFCSRCASNIIKGTRFGADNTIRVCNLCLEKLEREEDDPDEDDRRSLLSAVTSPFTAHQYPFSNSRDLHAIAEGHPRQRLHSFGSDEGSFGSRPRTPGNDIDLWDEMGASSQSFHANGVFGGRSFGGSLGKSAPFRRRILEDERMKDDVPFSGSPGTLGDDEGDDADPDGRGTKTPSPTDEDLDAVARGMHISVDQSAVIGGLGGLNSKSSIQFPGMSPERDRTLPLALSPTGFPMSGTPRRMSLSNLLSRSRVNSYGDSLEGGMIQAPFLRSRVQSRMSQSDAFESAARARRDST